METMAGKKPRRRRSFTPEFKAEVVALVRQPGYTVGRVAREMDLTETAVREWVRQAERDEGVRADGLRRQNGPRWPSCARSCGRRARSATSLSEQWLSLPGRPGEPAAVRRGGEG